VQHLVLLSGGYDSSVALAALRDAGEQATALFADYGQPAAAEELRAAEAVSGRYDTALATMAVTNVPVREGEIPGRNALLMALALTCAIPPSTVTLGVHGGTAYWDCGLEFLALAQQLADGYAGGGVQVIAPFAAWPKGDVYRYGRDLGVPEEITYSCERASGPCGTCLSCRDREAYARR
jgi:7-cyano-7-deazaguanine synthase